MSVLNKGENKKSKAYRDSIIKAFEEWNGDVRASARSLGVSREWIRRWCKKLDLDVNEYRLPRVEWKVMVNGSVVGHVKAANERQATAEAIKTLDINKSDYSKLRVSWSEE